MALASALLLLVFTAVVLPIGVIMLVRLFQDTAS